MVRDLCIREEYKDEQGNTKVSWPRIGVMFHKDDKRYIKLYHMPGVLIHAFERKEKDGKEESFVEEA